MSCAAGLPARSSLAATLREGKELPMVDLYAVPSSPTRTSADHVTGESSVAPVGAGMTLVMDGALAELGNTEGQ